MLKFVDNADEILPKTIFNVLQEAPAVLRTSKALSNLIVQGKLKSACLVNPIQIAKPETSSKASTSYMYLNQSPTGHVLVNKQTDIVCLNR